MTEQIPSPYSQKEPSPEEKLMIEAEIKQILDSIAPPPEKSTEEQSIKDIHDE